MLHGLKSKPAKPDSVTFEAQLKRAYKAGQSSRLQGLTREPPYGDCDLDLSWVCGFDATQREIEEFEEDAA